MGFSHSINWRLRCTRDSTYPPPPQRSGLPDYPNANGKGLEQHVWSRRHAQGHRRRYWNLSFISQKLVWFCYAIFKIGVFLLWLAIKNCLLLNVVLSCLVILFFLVIYTWFFSYTHCFWLIKMLLTSKRLVRFVGTCCFMFLCVFFWFVFSVRTVCYFFFILLVCNLLFLLIDPMN